MMDWAAQLLGLSPDFLNLSGKGGGAIMARAVFPLPRNFYLFIYFRRRLRILH